jgi:hypothetical protein
VSCLDLRADGAARLRVLGRELVRATSEETSQTIDRKVYTYNNWLL